MAKTFEISFTVKLFNDEVYAEDCATITANSYEGAIEKLRDHVSIEYPVWCSVEFQCIKDNEYEMIGVLR